MKILYVESINPDGLTGLCHITKDIYANVITLKGLKFLESILEDLGQNNIHTEIIIGGRYLSVVTMSLDEKDNQMYIFDLKNNLHKATVIANKFRDKEMYDEFLAAFNYLSKTYGSNYDSFTLGIGNAPSNIS
jgi:hypothetical protein